MDPFEWRRLLIGEDHPWTYLLEIMFRSVTMYTILLVFFKITGKKGIKQLTVFDLILIIGLGSAAGDPMFMADVPLLHALTVFVVILMLYLGLNRLTQVSHKVDVLLQGETTQLVKDGIVNLKQLKSEGWTTLELFAELRQNSISHLGQIRRAYLEFSGELSIYYFEDEQVIAGLPLYPENLKTASPVITEGGTYSCVQCGYTHAFPDAATAIACPHCSCTKVVTSICEKRIA
ncbi:MAG: DUF421 domain-containing protein [Sphingobacteriales bacterium]|nr:MAG: DUF421 domain-containing protein [Sphingobacteriales bacterium]